MKTDKMKFIFCSCNISMKEQVLSILEDSMVESYQVADMIISRCAKGSPRFNTPVWPGYNVNITMQITDHNRAEQIIALLKAVNDEPDRNPEEMLTVCSWDMNNCFFD